MRIGISLLLWTTEVNETHFPLFENLKCAGFDGVEVPVFDADIDRYRRIGSELTNLGLDCTSSSPVTAEANPISPDASTRQRAVDLLKSRLDCTVALGAELYLGPYHQVLGEFSGQPPTEVEKERVAEVHRTAAEHAQSLGLRMAVEYLNRFECYFINTMEDALAHVQRVDHPAFGTMFDTFHANIEERDPIGAIREAGDKLFYFHVSENDRGVPGRGHVPLLESFRALQDMGYDDWLTIEAFSRGLPDLAAATRVWRDYFANADEVIDEGVACVRETWAAARKVRTTSSDRRVSSLRRE
jgi:D-psicose/D-tagatose/L-ribulose 3-epimerase